MVTLKAARVLHVETGRIEEPGLVTVDGDCIAGGDGEGGEGDVLDLGDVTLLPGLMDMEVNLLMGGRGEVPGLSPSRTTRRCACSAGSPTHAGPCARGSPPSGTSACS